MFILSVILLIAQILTSLFLLYLYKKIKSIKIIEDTTLIAQNVALISDKAALIADKAALIADKTALLTDKTTLLTNLGQLQLLTEKLHDK